MYAEKKKFQYQQSMGMFQHYLFWEGMRDIIGYMSSIVSKCDSIVFDREVSVTTQFWGFLIEECMDLW